MSNSGASTALPLNDTDGVHGQLHLCGFTLASVSPCSSRGFAGGGSQPNVVRCKRVSCPQRSRGRLMVGHDVQMRQFTSALLAVLVVAVAVAVLMQATVPATPEGSISVTAVAIPRIFIVGERTGAFGSAVNASGVSAERHFVVCATGACQASGWGVVMPGAEWHGSAGTFVAGVAGSLSATWSLAEADDAAGARVTAVQSVMAQAMDPETLDAHR